MFESAAIDYRVGLDYRIGKILETDQKIRDVLIARGLIPGQVITLVRPLFFGRYWVVRVREQLIGLRRSELQRLQLYVINN